MSACATHIPSAAATVISKYDCKVRESGELSTFYVGSLDFSVEFDDTLLPQSYIGVKEWSGSGDKFYVSWQDSVVVAVQESDVKVEVFKTFSDFYVAVKTLESNFGVSKVLLTVN